MTGTITDMKMAGVGIHQEVQNVQIQCSCCGAKKSFRYSDGNVLSKVTGKEDG